MAIAGNFDSSLRNMWGFCYLLTKPGEMSGCFDIYFKKTSTRDAMTLSPILRHENKEYISQLAKQLYRVLKSWWKTFKRRLLHGSVSLKVVLVKHVPSRVMENLQLINSALAKLHMTTWRRKLSAMFSDQWLSVLEWVNQGEWGGDPNSPDVNDPLLGTRWG